MTVTPQEIAQLGLFWTAGNLGLVIVWLSAVPAAVVTAVFALVADG